MDPALRVKPWGSFNSAIGVMMSYPTVTSRGHLRYGSWRDISNPCVARVLAKLGYEHSQHFGRQHAMFGTDLFARRLNRNSPGFKTGSKKKALSYENMRRFLPADKVVYWEAEARKQWFKCTAPIKTLFGRATQEAYEAWMKAGLDGRRMDDGTVVTRIRLHGDIAREQTNYRRTWVYVERKDGVITRLVFPMLHPEVFTHFSHRSGHALFCAAKERLLDTALAFAFGDVLRPGLFTSRDYFVNIPSTMFVHRDHLDTANPRLSILFKRPLLVRHDLRTLQRQLYPMFDRLKADEIIKVIREAQTLVQESEVYWRQQHHDPDAEFKLFMTKTLIAAITCLECGVADRPGLVRPAGTPQATCVKCINKNPKLCSACSRMCPG